MQGILCQYSQRIWKSWKNQQHNQPSIFILIITHFMNRKLYALIGLALLAVAPLKAQTLKEGYVEPGVSSTDLLSAIDTYNSTGKINDDDKFYITRIKNKARFTNVATQVRPTLVGDADKRLLCWLPWEDDNVRGFTLGAIPTGTFDTEIFSMWQYVDHWGQFNGIPGRVAAALLDVAHKNGVAVSGNMGIPQAQLTSTAYYNYANNLSAAYGTKAAKMFFFYGSSGVGYNSEFTTTASIIGKFVAFHKQLNQDLKALGDPNAESIWYDGTNENGQNVFDAGLDNYGSIYGTDSEPVFSVFGNYNTMNNSTLLAKVETNASSYGRSPVYFYAGMNIQGGQPSTNWSVLKNYKASIGLWGAHTSNMFFQNRYVLGSTPAQQQRSYLLSTERWFTGGQRNPVYSTNPTDNTDYSPTNTSSPGMASMMSARSTLQWDLAEEPFVTFFNLGNGTFFNWKGERKNDWEWGNVGVQDYLPTWRFWFSKSFHGKGGIESARLTSQVGTGWDAQFTWDDAYVGGSCLELTGAQGQGTAYLALFKTQFDLKSGDQITLRYKVTEGLLDELQLNLYNNSSGAQACFACARSQHHDSDLWIEKTFTLTRNFHCDVIDLLLNASTEGCKVLLGELSIKRGTSATPATPNNVTSKVVYSGQTGIDAKLYWDMPGMNALPTATFNLDVNTSVFKLYSQLDDNEPVLHGITTSWAGLLYRVPNNGSKFRLGVSAVSTDFATESEIAWSDWQDVDAQTYTITDDIQIDKTTIKPGEQFTISYVDSKHENATWNIKNASGTTVATGTGTSITTSLSTTGVYDLELVGYTHADGFTPASATTTYSSYVIVSGEEVGAVPEIYTLKLNGEEDSAEGIEVNVDETQTFTYTARPSDGASSKGVDLDALGKFGFNYCKMKGVTAGDSELANTTAMTFTLTFWMKRLDDAKGAFIQMNDLQSDVWPHNNFCTYFTFDNRDLDATGAARKGCRLNIKGCGDSYAAYLNKGSAYSRPQNRMYFENTEIPVGQWVHIALVFKPVTSSYYLAKSGTYIMRTSRSSTAYGIDPEFYVNGVKQTCTRYAMQSEYDHLVAASGEYALDIQGPDDATKDVRTSRYSSTYTRGSYWAGFDAISMPRTSGTLLGIGGTSRPGAINAQVDHVAFYNTALSADDIAKTMTDDVPTTNLLALYTFDNDLNADNTYYPAQGSKTTVPAAVYKVGSTGSAEGSGNYYAADPTFVAGYPLLTGSNEVKTTATWNIPGADIISKTDKNNTSIKADDLEGSVTASWPMAGEREVTLTLTNDYGSDTKTIKKVIVIDPVTGIDGINTDAEGLRVVNADNYVLIEVPAAGLYNFRLYAADGRLCAEKTANLQAGATSLVRLPNTGVYILQTERDGNKLQSIKFIRN